MVDPMMIEKLNLKSYLNDIISGNIKKIVDKIYRVEEENITLTKHAIFDL